MDVVISIHAVAAVLLIVAGAAKVARPVPTAAMIKSLGLPSTVGLVMGLGVGEIGLGALALGAGSRFTAVAVGVVYVVFAIVVVRAVVVGAESCGCFGRTDAPPSRIHIVGNIALAAASLVAATSSRSPVDVMADQPGAGVPFVVLIGLLAGLAIIAFTALPEALAARHPSSEPATFSIDKPTRSL